MSTITLTTDFGTRDWFVGTMKGVVLAINPRASIVDIAHEIPQGDIRAGAFALMASCPHFPRGTVHVAVVDPGVGSQRRAIAVQTANGIFVGPDNGVLSWALARERIQLIRQLENARYFLKSVSRTFHGRDVFVPVAAHLSRGLPLSRLGRKLEDIVQLPWVGANRVKGNRDRKNTGGPFEVRGEVVYIDRFGNAITNIGPELSSPGKGATCEVLGTRRLRCPLADFYAAVAAGHPVAVIGSSELLEVAVNCGSAARKFGIRVGDTVVLRAKL
jgi:S-adenosylmethionine hydrolase